MDMIIGIIIGLILGKRDHSDCDPRETPEEKQARQQTLALAAADRRAARRERLDRMVGSAAWRRARGLSYWQWCLKSTRHPLSSRKLPEI